MAFWSGELLRDWIPKFGIIAPHQFHPKQIDCAAYTLRMGREAYITPDHQVSRLSTHTKILLTDREHFKIPAGQFAFLLTEEFVNLPRHVLGFISLKATIKFRGLINVSGFHVDPGFSGHLIYAVYNAGPSEISLEQGQDLFLMWLADLDRTDSDFVRRKEPLKNISATMIGDVHGHILTLQSMSKQLQDMRDTLFKIKAVGVIIGVFLGLLFGALKIDWLLEAASGVLHKLF